MHLRLIGFVVGGFLAAAAPASAEVQLSIQNGRVTLIARDSTVRQILTEWEKVGQAKIVNLDRISGGPLTLQLTNLPEMQALDILLRSVSGFMAAPRQPAIPNASLFDRILVLPMTQSAAPARPSTPQQASALVTPQTVQQFQPPLDSDGDVERPATPIRVPNAAPAQFSPFTQPQLVTPQMPAFPTDVPGVPSQPPVMAGTPAPPAQRSTATAGVAYPGAPTGVHAGVSVPGMTVPVPQVQQPAPHYVTRPDPRSSASPPASR